MVYLRRWCVLLVCSISVAATANDPAETEVGSQLSPKLRGLLLQEMNAVLGATKVIVDALVRGEHEVVAEQAQAIHDSFIMQQQMTAADKEDLLGTVPATFLKRDRAFHQLAGSLAEAARQEDSEAQQRLFSQTVNACVDCHSAHAQDRFPDLN